jgi:hypothetical protein
VVGGSRLIADPESIQKLVEYPRFRRIWESSQILEIERDPQIIDDVKCGNIVGVVTNPKVVALLNDPQIRSLLNQQDLDAALNASASESNGALRRIGRMELRSLACGNLKYSYGFHRV